MTSDAVKAGLMAPSWIAAALALAGLAACSSGGSGAPAPSEPAPFPPDPRSFADLVTAQDDILADLQGLPYSDPSQLPTSGSATYDGVFTLTNLSGDNTLPAKMAGDIRIGVDFDGAGAIEGTLTNFTDSANTPLAGEVVIVGETSINRDVDPNGGGWTYDVVGHSVGSITGPDGTDTPIHHGHLHGDFLGSDRSYTAGIVHLYGPNDPLPGLEGEFAAAR